jgi:hypothetical protein
MLDPFSTIQLAEVRYKERLQEAERLMAQASYAPHIEPGIRASLAAFVRRLVPQQAEIPCPEMPCDDPQPVRS